MVCVGVSVAGEGGCDALPLASLCRCMKEGWEGEQAGGSCRHRLTNLPSSPTP